MNARPIAFTCLVALGLPAAGLLILPGAGAPGRAQDIREVRREILELRELLAREDKTDPQAILKDLPGAAELDRQRLEVAEELRRLSIVELVVTPSPTAARGPLGPALMEYIKWSDRRLELSLGLAADEDRQGLIAGDVARAREIERLYDQITREERVTPATRTLLEFKFYRLGLESRLAGLAAGSK